MANVLYEKGKASTMRQLVDWVGDDIRCVLVKTSYSFSQTHEFLDDITVGNEVVRSLAMTGKTVSNDGIFDAADVTFTSVPTPHTVGSVVIFSNEGGADSARRLLVFLDTIAGMPFVTSGDDVQVVWDELTNKIFKM